jgi:DNA polymerase
MRDGCIRLDQAKYNIVMRIHDEFVAMMKEGCGSVQEMVGIISQPPKWAQDLPIAGEGWEGPRFRKG